MDRRYFLQLLSALPWALKINRAYSRTDLKQEIVPSSLLILIELKGGNDGLNTLVPYTDPLYYKLRPQLGLKEKILLELTQEYALHSSLAKTKKLFEQQQLAIIQGIGHANPNLSHFRSIDIWETASGPNQFLDNGWASCYLEKLTAPNDLTSGLIYGDSNLGPVRGQLSRVLVVQNIDRLEKIKLNKDSSEYKNIPDSLRHILKVEDQIDEGLKKLREKNNHHNVSLKNLGEGKGKLGKNVRELLKIFSQGHHAPLTKLSLAGFDTHSNQLASHQRLLEDLDDSFYTLSEGLKQLGLWENALIMTYSEFGRRVEENRNRGTDHGTANIHFALGGKVHGGKIYGDKVNLSKLDDGNLQASIDYRSLYTTIIKKWWKTSVQVPLDEKNFPPINFI